MIKSVDMLNQEDDDEDEDEDEVGAFVGAKNRKKNHSFYTLRILRTKFQK